jgi:hypothetical protein
MVSGFFDPRAAMRAIRGVPPRLQFSGRDGTFSYVVGERDQNTGRFIAKHTPLPFGFKAAGDWGTAERGWLSFNPYDDSHLVPIHHPVDPNPPGADYTLVVRIALHIERYGMAQWTVSGTIAQNAVFATFLAYQKAAEAAAGKIPVMLFDPSEQIPVRSRNGELFPVPRISIAGWIVRDPERWGARTVPMPVAQVGNDSDNGGMPLLASLVTSVAPTPTQPPPPANDVVPETETPANDDLFAGMTPASHNPPF